MRRIPTRMDFEYPGIRYNGEIFIIKESDKGNLGYYQYDGTSCLHGFITGFIYDSFKSKLKWLNPRIWNHKTCWSTDPMKVYFSMKEDYPNDLETWFSDEWMEKTYEKATRLGKPVTTILKSIMREVNKKTHRIYQLDFDELDYGKHWWEAHIPIKDYKGNKYLLTWQNCD